MAKIRMAQYGTKHGHARGKLQAMLVNPDVEVAGVFEPDAQQREKLQNDEGAFTDVHWFADAAEMLDDDTIVAIASEGNNAESLDQTEQIVNAGKHVWYDKPAGENWEQWQRVISTAQEKSLHVQMGYMLRYHSAFKQVAEWVKSGFLGMFFPFAPTCQPIFLTNRAPVSANTSAVSFSIWVDMYSTRCFGSSDDRRR